MMASFLFRKDKAKLLSRRRQELCFGVLFIFQS